MKNIKILLIASMASLLFSCSTNERADGYGNFEATEITVSSEGQGKLEYLNIREGEVLEKGASVGLVDTLPLYLNKQQLLASKAAISSKSGGISSQVAVFNQQMALAKAEQSRIQNMFNESAATQRQLEQVNSQVQVLTRQIQNVQTQNSPIQNEMKAIDAKVAQINDQIEKCKIRNPLKGTVLNQYMESSELVTYGKPLYKIANLDSMTLRVYVSENQLAAIQIGQEVGVKIDVGEGQKNYSGRIDWISDAAEFTPKIIQTKEERVNLVYAVKVAVVNDGSLKIGMPAEMWINASN